MRSLTLTACVLLISCTSITEAQQPLRQTIDAELQKVWKKEKIIPPKLADDATFLRRVYLDLAGIIPTAEEARAFLADESKDKRAKLIDTLLKSPRYAIHQTDVWDMVLFGRNHPCYYARERDGFKKLMQ